LVIEVSQETAAGFTLSRHHLLEPAPAEKALEVVDDILGLNAQGALNSQLSLWCRTGGLDPSYIPRALYEDRSLVRSWLMRDTVHIVPSRRLALFRRSLEYSLMLEWNRWTVKTGRKENPASWEPLYPKVLTALEGEPLTLNQIMDELGWTGREAKGKLHRLVREMSLRGLLCNATSSGPWHHNTEHTFTKVDTWLPNIVYKTNDEEEARQTLAKKYLRTYGPASVSDFAYWTGMRVREAKQIFESISEATVEVRVRDQSTKLLILKKDADSLIDSGFAADNVRLLPKFDALIMGHKDKSRLIDSNVREKVFLPTAEVSATLLLNGSVQGVWNIKRDKKSWKLTISLFRAISEEEIESIEEEVERMRKFTSFEIELDLG
jgi:hypothetical protein